jgi:hypothetical protein
VTFPQLATFAGSANGSPNPKRQIAGQNTLLVRSGHYIEYDEKNDEIMVANAFAQAILFFRGAVDGEEAPIRILMGPHTQIQSPDFGLSIDNVNDELYVTEHERILVFPRKANGDVAPIRILEGPKTELANLWGTAAVRGVGVDPIHNVLVVTGYFQNRGHVLIFDRTASGNTAPIRKIGGIGVWSVFDSGEIPPKYLLLKAGTRAGGGGGGEGGGDGAGEGGGGLGSRFTFNPKTKELFNNSGAEIEAYSVPEIF